MLAYRWYDEAWVTVMIEYRSTSNFCLTLVAAGLAASFLAVTPAKAEFSKINHIDDFKSLVAGKTLTRPLVRLEVSPEGDISGIGVTWEVSGQWVWQDGFFCRSLFWGGSELGYNCQEVAVNSGKVRFTSDRGTGDYADFNLKAD
jgi:hypothetical protein